MCEDLLNFRLQKCVMLSHPHSFRVVLLSLNVVLSQISAGPYFKTEPERSVIVFVLSSHPVDLEEEKGGQRISKSSLSSFL